VHNRMLARRPKGLRPKQRVTIVIRCPETGALAPHTRRAVEMAEWQPYGQGGRSFEVWALWAEGRAARAVPL